RYFENSAVFGQKLKVSSPSDFDIEVWLMGQSCSDETGMCIPFKKLVHKISIPGNPNPTHVSAPAEAPSVLEGITQTPTVNTSVAIDSTVINNTGIPDYNVAEPEMYSEEAVANLEAACGDVDLVDNSIWGIFIQGFLGGFLALLMPCIFPMIPLTVSFFTKQSKTRSKGIANAIIYAISIILIYTFLGFVVTLLFGPEALNKFSTNGWVNLAFFAIFVVFAISFFGAFEITLPQGLVNKVDSASNKGGLIGIF